MNFARDLIGAELDLFEKEFRNATKASNPLLERIMRFIVRRKGKGLRPMYVFLCARMAGGVQPATYRAASLIELLHTATLVHDDVVDDALQRRGFFSINALWKNKIAVLVGDYLLSKGLLLSIDNGDFRILQITSRAVREMSEGELLQMEKARKLDISETVYFDIIRAKTASLLASACAAGAWSACEDETTTEIFRKFGEAVGIAFQIKDDLFDYGADSVGKPTGIDIREKKMTLPLIYTLQQADRETRRHIIYDVRNRNTNKDAVAGIIQQVIDTGGIEYARQKMYAYRDEALALLQAFPADDSRRALEELVNYAIDRKY
ncbi:MAG: polyprenyl synthetase family protein [Sphingobacteriales bacterium]|nr:MAG: polyprenyl synthetase family protein [Sphingobacteriales bacterium]